MAMNRIQFQKGLSMAEFLRRYGSEELCQTELERWRWPEGYRCPRCFFAEHGVFFREGLKYWECRRCGYQTTVLSGTIFQSTKLPLTRWFLAMHLLTQSKNDISARELMRQLAVSYPTAWLLKHKLMHVMEMKEESRVLSGRVEIDDAYLGGERSGTRGRGSENKVPFIAAVQTTDEGHPLSMSLDVVAGFTRESVESWANKVLSATTQAVSDGLQCFRAVSASVASHRAIVVGGGKTSVQRPEFRWVNTCLGNLKTSLSGTCHSIKFSKYGQRYLKEFQYRFNHRFYLPALLPDLIQAVVMTGPCPERVIRAG